MYAVEDIIENEDMLGVAGTIRKKGTKKIDSLHIACAIHAGADYFDNG